MSQRNPDSQVRLESLWILEPAEAAGSTIEEKAGAVLEVIEARAGEFEGIRSRLTGVDICCYVDIMGEQVGIAISAGLIARIARVGASLEFDGFVEAESKGSE